MSLCEMYRFRLDLGMDANSSVLIFDLSIVILDALSVSVAFLIIHALALLAMNRSSKSVKKLMLFIPFWEIISNNLQMK